MTPTLIPMATPLTAILKRDEQVKLDRLQRDILGPQLESLRPAAPDAKARALIERCQKRLMCLKLAPELARLGAIVEVLLTSRRVSNLYGPDTTPGRATIEGISAVARAVYALTIKNAEVQVPESL
jgi:hypothetical protein